MIILNDFSGHYWKLYFRRPYYLGPEKKRDFSWQKPWGRFLKTVISFLNTKTVKNGGISQKSVIYRDQKSKKPLPNDRHNERAVGRILNENGAEISDNYSHVHWHVITSRVFFWMAVLSLLALVNEPCFQHETCIFSKYVFTNCWFLCLCGKKKTSIPWNRGTLLENRETTWNPWSWWVTSWKPWSQFFPGLNTTRLFSGKKRKMKGNILKTEDQFSRKEMWYYV